MLIIRRLNCTDAASGIVNLGQWTSVAQYMSANLYDIYCAPDGHLLKVTIPEVA